MFEFVEKVATDIITSLGNTINQMSFDASSYDAQAADNDAKAAQCEADASAEVASCPHYKSEPYETTDDDGNTVTKYEQVPDTAADAAAMARAATLRAEAANLKAIAAALRGLAAALRGTLFSMTSQQKQISQASQDSQFAIVATTKLLREGIDVTKRVIAAFNVPEASNFKEWTSAVGDNLLKAIGVDLSDGLNDEIYTAIGVATTVGAIAGPLVVRRTTSIIGAKMGNGIIGNIGRYEANIAADAIIKTYFNETGAKVAQNAIASALTFIGIDSLPTDRSEFVNKDVEVDSEDKKVDGKLAEKESTSNQNASLDAKKAENTGLNSESKNAGNQQNASVNNADKNAGTMGNNKTTNASKINLKDGQNNDRIGYQASGKYAANDKTIAELKEEIQKKQAELDKTPEISNSTTVRLEKEIEKAQKELRLRENMYTNYQNSNGKVSIDKDNPLVNKDTFNGSKAKKK